MDVKGAPYTRAELGSELEVELELAPELRPSRFPDLGVLGRKEPLGRLVRTTRAGGADTGNGQTGQTGEAGCGVWGGRWRCQ